MRNREFKQAKNFILDNYDLPKREELIAMIRTICAEKVAEAIKAVDLQEIITRRLNDRLKEETASLSRKAASEFSHAMSDRVRDEIMKKLLLKVELVADISDTVNETELD